MGKWLRWRERITCWMRGLWYLRGIPLRSLLLMVGVRMLLVLEVAVVLIINDHLLIHIKRITIYKNRLILKVIRLNRFNSRAHIRRRKFGLCLLIMAKILCFLIVYRCQSFQILWWTLRSSGLYQKIWIILQIYLQPIKMVLKVHYHKNLSHMSVETITHPLIPPLTASPAPNPAKWARKPPPISSPAA